MKKYFLLLIFLSSFLFSQQETDNFNYASDMRGYINQIKQSIVVVQIELNSTKTDLEKAKQNLKTAEEATQNAIFCAEQWGDRLQENNEDLALAYEEIDDLKQKLEQTITELNAAEKNFRGFNIEKGLYKTLMIIAFILAAIGWFIVLIKKIPFLGKLIF
jgi:chromosome segregation ATPase